MGPTHALHGTALLLGLPMVLACAGLAPSAGPAPSEPDRSPATRRVPPATPPPRRNDVRELPSSIEGCLAPGAWALRDDEDRVPSLLLVGPGKGPRTLVIALHGGGGDARRILTQTRWHTKAEVEGDVAVLVPHAQEMAGHGPHWNTGKFDTVVGPEAGRDDVTYLSDRIREAQRLTCADRVLGVGFSNGGQMIHRLACQGDVLDAVVSSAGTLLVDPATCDRPTPLLSYVGEEDRVYDTSPLEGAGQPPVPESAALWATINGCSDAPPTVVPGRDKTCTTWQGCKAPTELCVVHGMPHAWPAPWGQKAAPVDATTEGWAWFLGLPPR